MREFHGLRNTREYNIWNAMKQRCQNPNATSFRRYGAIGISVCKSWSESFVNFYNDMGPRPSINHSIERINNGIGYRPDNCKWATPEEQANNTKSNFTIIIDGVKKTVAMWSKETGVPSYVIRARIHNHGWSYKKAIFTPVGKQLFYKGKSKTLSEWCKALGLEYFKTQARIKKLSWPVKKAFEKP